MKNLRKHILRSLMGVAGLLTFTACYGPYIPTEDLEYPGEDTKVTCPAQQEQQEAEAKEDTDVTAEL